MIHRVKVLAFVLLGISLLMASAVAATSSALPELLNAKQEVPGSVKMRNPLQKSTAEFSILGGFAIQKCAEGESESETEGTGVLGPFHLTVLGCTTNLGGTCTGLGDTSGVILMLGSFHIVYDTLSALGAAILFLLQHVHYSCTVLAVEKLLLALGQMLCLIGTINALTRSNELKCLGTGGDPKETRYWNDAGTEVNIGEGLRVSENDGVTYKMAAMQGTATGETSEELEVMA